MLLSIGMMVKNEEKYLDKCLNALKPLLENLDSELIIIDTGSTDNTVEIAKRYTDKVYFHKWNNDFAKMRNTVLSYCTGEWFLSVDGDEVFEDCSSIIDFFKSKEYLQFGSATINIRNITQTKNETNFLLFSPPRLFRKDKDFKYTGIIHEQPLIKTPIKYVHSTCNHYGYVVEDKDLMEKKFKRNTALLKDALSKDPNNIYYLFQLASSYSMYKDHDEAVKIIKKAYNLAKNQPNKINYLNVYQTLCIEHLNINDYNSLERYSLEALEIRNDFIDFHYFLGAAQMQLEKNNEAISAFKSYLDLYHNFNNLEKNIIFNYYSLSYLNRVYYCLCELYIKIEDYANAISVLLLIDENKYKLQPVHKNFIDGIIKSKKYEFLVTYEKELINNERRKQLDDFYITLDNFKLSLDKATSNLIEELFSNGTSGYNILNQIIINYRNNDSIDINTFKNFISKIDFSKENYYYGDLIYLLLLEKYDMAKLFAKCSFNKISSFFQYISEKYEDTSSLIYNYIDNTEIKDRFIYVRFYKELLHYLVILDNLDSDKLEKVYNLYLEYGFKYLNFVYTNLIIDMAYIGDVKNDEEGFLLLLNKAFRYRDNNTRLYIKSLKEALELFKPMKNLIEFLLNQIQ